MLGLAIAVAMVVWVISAVAGLSGIAMFIVGPVFVAELAAVRVIARNDHHIVSVFRTSMRFWSGSRPRRWLSAGAPSPCSSRRGGRS